LKEDNKITLDTKVRLQLKTEAYTVLRHGVQFIEIRILAYLSQRDQTQYRQLPI